MGRGFPRLTNMNKQIAKLIASTITTGISQGAHKGNLQDMVWSALGRNLTMEEAAHAQRTLDASGYRAPTGFKP